MGFVYEGRDLQLDRRVAVKILPLVFAAEAEERILRFQRESHAASALNHPNIVSIFDADFNQGYHYIAMEYVEGKTLRQLAASESSKPDGKTILDLVGQTASALSAAHEAGIVHRDMKPENIMVRPDGYLSKCSTSAGPSCAMLPATPSYRELRTRPGSLPGTIQYLSPEQVLGKQAGPRSDLFSLGVVAYELSTGVRPFDGPTDGAVFDAILNRTPELPSSIRPSLGNELDGLIMRALEKDPELRFQTATDMRAALRLLVRNSQTAGAAKTVRKTERTSRALRWGPVALATIAGMALMGLVRFGFSPAPASLPYRFERMTFGEGEEIYPNLSPDGKQFIYASSARGHWDIYLQRAGGSAAIDLTVDSAVDNTEPALSRDGSRIASAASRGDGGLFVMEATGENPRRISARGHMPSWAPNGKFIAYCDDTFVMPNDRGGHGSSLHVLDLTTGAERDIWQTGDAVQPNWSPHGQRIAYWGIYNGSNREIFTVSTDGGLPVQVTKGSTVDWNPVWSPSGQELYFISDRGGTMNLWRVRIDERTGETSGDPEPVTTPAVYVRFLSWSADGSKFLFSQSQNRISLSSIEFDKSCMETVGDPIPVGGAYNIGNFSVSPDGTRIVYDTVGDPHEDLWIVNLDGSGRRALTSDSFRNRLPAWSPAGDEILFISTRSGLYQEWVIRPDGSGLRQVTAATNMVNAGVWIDGGKRVVASLFGLGLALLDLGAGLPVVEPKMLPGIESLKDGSYAFVSPPENGLLLGHIAGFGANPLILYSLAEGKLTRLGVRGTRPAWSPGSNNRYFVFLREDACYLYDREQKREKRLFSTAHNQIYFMQIGASGRRIYFTQTIRDAHLWMGELGH